MDFGVAAREDCGNLDEQSHFRMFFVGRIFRLTRWRHAGCPQYQESIRGGRKVDPTQPSQAVQEMGSFLAMFRHLSRQPTPWHAGFPGASGLVRRGGQGWPGYGSVVARPPGSSRGAPGVSQGVRFNPRKFTQAGLLQWAYPWRTGRGTRRADNAGLRSARMNTMLSWEQPTSARLRWPRSARANRARRRSRPAPLIYCATPFARL